MPVANKIRMDQLDSGSLTNFINYGMQIGAFSNPVGFNPTGYVAVNSVANLRSLSISGIGDKAIAFVNSYYGDNKGGGGTFIWDFSSSFDDDSGRYIIPDNLSTTTGRWVRLIEAEADVRMWGAKGDGINDDTLALQAAFDMGASKRYTIKVSKGDYLVSAPLKLSLFKLIGEGPQSKFKAAVGYSGDILQAHNAAYQSSGVTFEAVFGLFDYMECVQNLGFEMPIGGTGAGFSIMQPGEGNFCQNLTISGGQYGVKCYLNGGPGMRLANIMSYDTEATVGYESANITGVIPHPFSYSNDSVLKSIQSITTHPSVTGKASVVREISGMMYLRIINLTARGNYGSGIIYRRHGEDNGGPFGYTHVQGGYVERLRNGTTGTVPFVMVSGATTPQSYIPPIRIHGVYMYDIDYLIEDHLIPTLTGANSDISGTPFISGTGIGDTPYRLYPDSFSGLQCRLPLTYYATRSSAGSPGFDYAYMVRRRIDRKSRVVTKFTPLQTGWFRIASNVNQNSFGGRFTILDESGLSYLQFDCVSRKTTGNMKIISAITGFSSGQRISGVRMGWTIGDYGFVDVAIRQAYTTGDNPRDSFISVFHRDDGFEYYYSDVTQITDPAFIPFFQSGTNYLIQKNLDSSLVGDIII